LSVQRQDREGAQYGNHPPLLRSSLPGGCAVDFHRKQDTTRTRGSHRQYKHLSKPGTVTVAGKPNLDVPPGTLNAILKQAGLKKER
jgi:predicted RNA binding protein YcfA (HicA-like mRNA interferase family)